MAQVKKGPRKKRQRKRMVVLAALRVAADPHPDGLYERLFKRAVGRAKRIAGDRKVEIGNVQNYDNETLTGQIWSYTHIDRRKGVVDLKNRKIFTRAEVQQFITSDFDERGVNHRAFWFGFHLESHVLVYERTAMSPRALAHVLEGILGAVKDQVNVKTLSVNVVQDAAALDRIFALDLNRLSIRLSRPNPADLSGMLEQFRAKLDRQHARAETIILEAEDGTPLEPDEETKLLAALGNTIGEVQGRGYDSTIKRTVTKSTADTPLVHHALFDPKEGIDAEGFMAKYTPAVGQQAAERVEVIQKQWVNKQTKSG